MSCRICKPRGGGRGYINLFGKIGYCNNFIKSNFHNFIDVNRKNFTTGNLKSNDAKDEASFTITSDTIRIDGQSFPVDDFTNVTPNILSKIKRQLHLHQSHPISILRNLIETQLNDFRHFNSFSPIVSTRQNFDDLGFPIDHVGRNKTDSYYINRSVMLRTHTSAHQLQILSAGENKFLVSADVYRRDEIDSNHYPVFHQMEGVQVFDVAEAKEQVSCDITKIGQFNSACVLISNEADTDTSTNNQKNPIQFCHPVEAANSVGLHLKHTLNELVKRLFKDEKELKVRWIDAYFPFTSPSWEMEVLYQGKWLEICGCGVILQDLMNKAVRPNEIGWAFGLGLERIAMVLFDIPDIRLFWSNDPRFLDQFTTNEIKKFKPFSKYPASTRDISFWVDNNKGFHENNFCELVRSIAGDLVEDAKMIDEFVHPISKRRSLCYRIIYRSMDRNVTNEEINQIQLDVQKEVQTQLGVILR
ncbi:9326_t:CDS:2 [Ambispora gerdemannii]|uniref:Phenylalanine--tRNA ligase, mitochondrial n=1 Tax=Ambispora gerdemannii TaxID=144530 RepID=A0A9N9FP46_9GLOM|nr:9326_t:CDS:2 [Ambispora gerdemannii]